MANTVIQLKKSIVAGHVPNSLSDGELALNAADGILYYKDYGNNSIRILTKTSTVSSNSFSTINANSSLIIATSPTDILSLVPGNNVTITSNYSNKSITIGSDLSPAFVQINSNYSLAVSAYNQANSAYAQSNTQISNLANSSYKVTLRSDGQVLFPQTVVGSYNAASLTTAGAFLFNANGNLWEFDTNGNLISPYSVKITNSGFQFPDGSYQNTAAASIAYSQASYNTANAAWNQANNAYNAANTVTNKTYTFFQNTAPSTANTRDQWIHSDNGVMYENFGNTSSPIWVELGPTGAALNAGPFLVTSLTASSNATIGATLYSNNGIYSSNNFIGSYTDGIVVDYVSGNGRISVGSNDGIIFYNGGVASNPILNISNTGQLISVYKPPTAIGSAIQITAANTVGGTGYADFLKFINSSGGTNPNKTIRINSSGDLQIVNSAYQITSMSLTDGGDLTIAGNSTFNGIGAGYAPNRPAFCVRGNGGQVSATTTLTNSNWNIEYNQGSYLNGTTGIFTAPVAGLYQVNLVIRTSTNSYNGIIQALVRKTAAIGGGTTTVIMVEFGNNTSMNHAGGSNIVKLAVGDTLQLIASAGTISFDGNDNWSVAYIG